MANSKIKHSSIIDEIALKKELENLIKYDNTGINNIFKNHILFEWIIDVIKKDKILYIFSQFHSYIEIANNYKYLNHSEADIFTLYKYRDCGYFIFHDDRTAFYKYICSIYVIMKIPSLYSRVHHEYLEKITQTIQDNKNLISRYTTEELYQNMIKINSSDFVRISYN